MLNPLRKLLSDLLIMEISPEQQRKLSGEMKVTCSFISLSMTNLKQSKANRSWEQTCCYCDVHRLKLICFLFLLLRSPLRETRLPYNKNNMCGCISCITDLALHVSVLYCGQLYTDHNLKFSRRYVFFVFVFKDSNAL